MKKVKKKVGIKEYLKKEYNNSFNFIIESKKYIYTIIGLFSFFALIGFFVPIPEEIILKIIEFFKELISKTEQFNQLEMISFLFKNNILASFFGLVFGAFFGIFSIINAALNGFILGVVSNMSVAENGALSLFRLVPHGIFELPALFISLGMGLRLGFFIFSKEKVKEFNYRLKGSLKSFLMVIIPLLLIAAIIEGLLIIFSR